MLSLLRLIANQLAPLTLLGAILAYLYPPLFMVFAESVLGMKLVLWMFAITMFALGLVLETEELMQTLRRPVPIALGLLTQFTVMPALAILVVWLGDLPPAFALGVIIVGCAPGAMASNVIVYLAGGALAFSITLTFIATMLAPILTPTLVQWLGSAYFEIPFWGLMLTITKILVIPLLLGMVFKRLLLKPRQQEWTQAIAPAMGSLAIIIICSQAVAANQAQLASAGLALFGWVVFINAAGYLLGWLLGSLYRFAAPYRVTLTIEIGMQNAGLGVALALAHFSAETALPGALFAFWSVITAAVATRILRHRQQQQLPPQDLFAD